MSGSRSSLRTFVAVALDEAVRAELSRARERLASALPGPGIRWGRDENLHLTLRFLGATPPDRVSPLLTALERALARVAPFELELASVGPFPNARRARVVAASVVGAERLGVLVGAVEAAVASCGFPLEDRPFRAHLTLGRVRGRLAEGQRLRERLAPLALRVADVVLFESVLGRDGARYSELGRARLGAGAAPGERRS